MKLTAERVRNKMSKQKYLVSNLVYGQVYTGLFLEHQLKSLCDPTNFPALRERYDIEYLIFSDEETLPMITRHPHFLALSQICEINVIKISWPPDSDRFAIRYNALIDVFHQTLNHALLKKVDAMSVWVADLVFAQHALPRMLKHLEQGHDGVLMVPIRAAVDGAAHILNKMPGAPSDLELFELAYRNLHHLWIACHWHAPMFTRMPYSMLWNSYSGLCAHHFGITPIVFKPSEAMKGVRGVIDSDVPGFLQKPYWCTDWTDAPVAGIEPLSNGHYPPFAPHRADVSEVAKWSQIGTVPGQSTFLTRPMFYPSRKTFNNDEIADGAEQTMRALVTRILELRKS